MAGFMAKYGGETYALMRIVTGLLFLWHGTQKLFGFPAESPPEAPAFVCSGLMAAAYWLAHGTKALFPILNQGELAALYCFVFLFISAHGAGKWSLDGQGGRG
jgi:putative oxidoreductase